MRMSKLAAVASLAATALLGAAAPATPETVLSAPKPARQCFFARNVNNFQAVDDKVVNIRVGVRDVYQLELLGHCPDIDWSWKLAIKSRGSTICTGLDADLIVPSTIGPRTCPVRTVRKLTPQEVAALPSKQRP
jgi:hypothetical protein